VALDRFGRRGLFLSGIFFMGLTTLAITFFPAFAPLLVLRILMGAVWAVANTSSSTVAADIIPHRRFGEGIGFYGLSASFAMALSPALSLYLFHAQGIKPALFMGFVAFMASLLIAIPIKHRSANREYGDVRPSHGTASSPSPQPSSSAASSSPTALSPSARPAPATQPPSPATPISPASSHRGIAVFIEPKALLPALMAFFLMGSFGAIQAFAAILAESRLIEGAPFFFFAFAGLMLVTRPLFGRLIDRRGYRLPLVIGLIFAFAGLVVLSFASTLVILLAAGALVGIGFGAANPTTQAMAVADVPFARRGTATATYFVGFDAGIGVGAVAAGLLSNGLGYGPMFQVMALLPLATLLIFLLAGRRYRVR
jgi:MFS family permease